MVRAVFLLFSFAASPLQAEVLMTLKEGLRAAFPGADRVKRKEIYLTGTDKANIEKRYSIKPNSAYFVRYTVMVRGQLAGYAYIDRHVVRSKMQSILIAFDEQSQVKRVITLSFDEPPIYIAGRSWLEGFEKQDPANLNMPGLLGSTITAHRIIKSVNYIGAIHSYALELN